MTPPPPPPDDPTASAGAPGSREAKAEAERRAGPRVLAPVGPLGGPTLAYRGATFEANPTAALHVFRLPGHPYDGVCFGALGGPVRLVDWWLDRDHALPPPYRLPDGPGGRAGATP